MRHEMTYEEKYRMMVGKELKETDGAAGREGSREGMGNGIQ